MPWNTFPVYSYFLAFTSTEAGLCHPLQILRFSLISLSIMLVTASGFSALIQALGLTQGFSKPNPSPGLSTSSTDNLTPSLPLVPNPVQLGVNDLQAALGDSSCNGYPYDVPSPGYQPPPPFDQAEANIYRYRQQQSVNLGSW